MDVDELLRSALQRQATSADIGALDGPALRARCRGRRHAKLALSLAASSLAIVIAVPLPWASWFDINTASDGTTAAASNEMDHGPLFDNPALRARATAAAQRPLVNGGLGWADSRLVVIFAGGVDGRRIVVLERRSPRGERELGMVATATSGDGQLAAVALSVGSTDRRPSQISAVLGDLLIMFTGTSSDAARWVLHDPHGGKLGGSFSLDKGLWTADLEGLPDRVWAGARDPLLGIQLSVDERTFYRGPVGPLPLRLFHR
jgi:hypothetical protein